MSDVLERLASDEAYEVVQRMLKHCKEGEKHLENMKESDKEKQGEQRQF